METEGRRESDNVEDRRSQGGGGGGGGGLGRGGGIGGRNIGIGSIVIALAASYFLGVNPMTVLGILGGGGGGAPVSQEPVQRPPANDPLAKFVSTVLADTEDVWGKVFSQGGSAYKAPKLVLFRGSTPTACGTGQSAMGPFYCPGDQKVYIDLSFYETMRSKLGAPGDFAQAYVVAHEIGHHLQNQLGISGKVDAMRGRISEREQNGLSVRLELQADCFAGVWSHHSQLSLDKGDIQEALNAASQIGDDTLQKRSQGYAQPETFTHGSSQQRMKWFSAGLQSGNMKSCDTFNAQGI